MMKALLLGLGLGLVAAAYADDEDPYYEDPAAVDLIAAQFTCSDPYPTEAERLAAITAGDVKLVAISNVQISGLAPGGPNHSSYTGVLGEFCADVESNGCDDDCRYTFDLRYVVDSIGDEGNVLPLSGSLFDVSGCGASLVSNAISDQFGSSALVVSDSQAVAKALAACDGHTPGTCSADKHKALVRDVVSLLGRVPAGSGQTGLYIKFRSSSSAYIDLVMNGIYPDEPWVFSSCAADAALAQTTGSLESSDCIKSTFTNPAVSSDTVEACDYYLASLVDGAEDAAAAPGSSGLIVDYVSEVRDADYVVGTLLPHLGLEGADPVAVQSIIAAHSLGDSTSGYQSTGRLLRESMERLQARRRK